MGWDFDESRYQKRICYVCSKEWLGGSMMFGVEPICYRYACSDCIAKGHPHDSHQESIDKREQQRKRVLASINPEDPSSLIAAALHLLLWEEADQTVQFEPEWGEIGHMLQAYCKTHPTEASALLKGVRRLWAYSEREKQRAKPSPERVAAIRKMAGLPEEQSEENKGGGSKGLTRQGAAAKVASAVNGSAATTTKRGRKGSSEVLK